MVADHLADLIDLIAHIPEEAHRRPHTIAGDIAVDALPGVLLKETAEMPLGYADRFGDARDADGILTLVICDVSDGTLYIAMHLRVRVL